MRTSEEAGLTRRSRRDGSIAALATTKRRSETSQSSQPYNGSETNRTAVALSDIKNQKNIS